MTAPTSPYCTSADVAALLPNLINWQEDFSTATTPTKIAVTGLISRWAAKVDMAFAAQGYYVPFEEYESEDWPAWQTGMLLLMNSLAVAGAISGPVVKPAPAIGSKKGYDDNPYTAEFRDLLNNVKENGLGFRARVRVGSPAEQWVESPSGPITDYLLGYIDESNWQTITEYTGLIERVRQEYFVGMNRWPTDHMALRRRELIGI